MAGMSMPLFNLITGTLVAMLNKQIENSDWKKILQYFCLLTNKPKSTLCQRLTLNWCKANARLNADDQHKSCRSNNWQFTIEHCSHHVFAFLFPSRCFFFGTFLLRQIVDYKSLLHCQCVCDDGRVSVVLGHLCAESIFAALRRISAIE